MGQSTIDFESLPAMSNSPGSPIPTAARLYDQLLATHGVVFSSGSAFVGVVDLGPGGTPSGTHGIGGSTAGGLLTYSSAPLFRVEFFLPTQTTQAAVTNFVTIRGDLQPAAGILSMAAYDLYGELIGSHQATDTGGTMLAVFAPGIHAIEVTGTGTVAFDDLSYGELSAATATPEPGSLLLLGTGLAALSDRRRRRRG